MSLNIEARPFLRNGSEHRANAGPKLLVLWLSLGLALALASTASAQSYRVLKSFTGGSDGRLPVAGLILAGTTLYGTTVGGGSSGHGVVFKMNTDGSGYAVLKYFTGDDGAYPEAALVLEGGTLYGTTEGGGTWGAGVVFRINIDGSGYAVLKNINCYTDGGNPFAGLVLAGHTLYGTTSNAGVGLGAVFKVNTDGSGYAPIKNFTGSDGGWPFAGLLWANSTLYGSAFTGGTSDYGVVFKVSTDGSGYTVLKNFTGGTDGSSPRGDLVLASGTLYGTTSSGVFKLSIDGTGYTVLKNFTGNDGANSYAGLVLASNILYGTTCYGGSGNGVVFKINTDGSCYEVLKYFSGTDGANPQADLLLAGGTLYGTTGFGGDFNEGVVFSVSLTMPPSITTQPSTQTAELGATVDFSAGVTNTPPESTHYQWYFNGSNAVGGATRSHLYLTNVQSAGAGSYTVVVTNLAGAVTSLPAMLNVIAPVPRKTVPALTLMGQTGSFLSLDYRTAPDSSANWETFDTVSLTNAPQKYFDLTAPLAQERFYRAWQTNVLSPPSILDVHLVPAITLTGAIGSSVRIDYINQFGPIGAWVTNLATVTLTNSPQLYFDTSIIGQPPRLWRLVPVP